MLPEQHALKAAALTECRSDSYILVRTWDCRVLIIVMLLSCAVRIITFLFFSLRLFVFFSFSRFFQILTRSEFGGGTSLSFWILNPRKSEPSPERTNHRNGFRFDTVGKAETEFCTKTVWSLQHWHFIGGWFHPPNLHVALDVSIDHGIQDRDDEGYRMMTEDSSGQDGKSSPALLRWNRPSRRINIIVSHQMETI